VAGVSGAWKETGCPPAKRDGPLASKSAQAKIK